MQLRKTHLKSILIDSIDHNGYHVRIQLPGESSANLQCTFGMDVTARSGNMCNCFLFTNLMLQNLYQYAFAFSTIHGSFIIYTMSQRSSVPCTDLVLGDGSYGHAFAVKELIQLLFLFLLYTSESIENIVVSNEAESNMQTVENNVASTGRI